MVGCAAERLGVRVPPTGLDAINLEDLQRDAFALTGPQVGPRGPGQPGAAVAAEWMQQRLSQMELVPAFGRAWATPLPDGRAVVCGQRDGQRPDVIGVFAVDAGNLSAHVTHADHGQLVGSLDDLVTACVGLIRNRDRRGELGARAWNARSASVATWDDAAASFSRQVTPWYASLG